MSIPVPRDAPEWILVFADETHTTSQQGAWSESADQTTIDGLTVYLTRQPIKELLVVFPGCAIPITVLRPPMPTPLFAHKRYRVPASSEGTAQAEWRYTCFGYVLGDDYRVTLTVSHEDIDCTLTPRSTPFCA